MFVGADERRLTVGLPITLKESQFKTEKRFWQFYQGHFTNFLMSIHKSSKGPMSVAIVVEDLNGETYTYLNTKPDRFPFLVEALNKRINYLKGKKCLKHKLRDTLMKLLS